MIAQLVNLSAVPVVAQDAAATGTFCVVRAGATEWVSVPTGTVFVLSHYSDAATFTTTGGAVVVVQDDSFSVVTESALRGFGPVTHVENPVQGMEFVLLALGFVVGAITWRFILGRW